MSWCPGWLGARQAGEDGDGDDRGGDDDLQRWQALLAVLAAAVLVLLLSDQQDQLPRPRQRQHSPWWADVDFHRLQCCQQRYRALLVERLHEVRVPAEQGSGLLELGLVPVALMPGSCFAEQQLDLPDAEQRVALLEGPGQDFERQVAWAGHQPL